MRRLLLTLVLLVPFSAAAQNIALTQVASGLDLPLGIAHAGDTRLFIVQQRGRIVVFNGTSVLAQPFLDVSSLVSCCGEQGLLGLAFHPRYRDNGFFYIDYTDRSGNTVVARYSVSSTDPNRADPSSARVLLNVAQPFANHNGGHLAFGPDNYLYIALGDGGSGGDPGNRAQDLSTLLGKILRIDIDGGSPYAIPPSNPFVNRAGARGEIWAYGLRNPWRFSFDRVTGDLWIADVGQNIWEEVNYAPATSIGGENYGWRRMEATHCFQPATNCSDASLTLPVFEYSHAEGCSVTGGYVYRGTRYPALTNTYLFGDYCSGSVWGTKRSGNGTFATKKLLTTDASITGFGEDVAGELYLIDQGRGRVYSIRETTPATPRRRSAQH
jgi:glucose/arabinose dehydrogenase